jgi:hypothetical protein
MVHLAWRTGAVARQAETSTTQLDLGQECGARLAYFFSYPFPVASRAGVASAGCAQCVAGRTTAPDAIAVLFGVGATSCRHARRDAAMLRHASARLGNAIRPR